MPEPDRNNSNVLFNEYVNKLSYQELQDICRKLDVDNTGTKEQLIVKIGNTVKRPPSEVKCAITMELPFDPVKAKDGRIYERSAVENHLQKSKTSPVTNEPMARQLVDAPQHRFLVELLIKMGIISGELLDSWKIKEKEKEEMDALLKLASGGDKHAMSTAGTNYRFGREGFRKDLKLAYVWFHKAHVAGSVRATANLGDLLCKGKGGVKANHQLGMMYIAMAAGQGSKYAAYKLADAFSYGKYGTPVDKEAALRWAHKALNDDENGTMLRDTTRTDAQKLLDELMSDNATVS
ncbi:Sel1 domain protein repeat-containing protein [Seminavis robusta]|uniref:Sel1 domain protein repeat-containing protein n=1 Tax=Seminavis robusta TaxID=568900 RepID=A0A9N8HWS6_9STRA|nr:Sel1 domain protein repeat-containing protein [Seminavis robusta]|eukprot:Sro1692_g291560.1 Sel1 domain protein repeat-containing protein (293) ;mRNA; f:18266-19144